MKKYLYYGRVFDSAVLFDASMIHEDDFDKGTVWVTDELKKYGESVEILQIITNANDWLGFLTAEEQNAAWKPEQKEEGYGERIERILSGVVPFIDFTQLDADDPIVPGHPDYRETITAGDEVKKDAINPDHYKNYLVIQFGEEEAIKMQWMENQQFKPYFRANPKALFHAVLMQADKYLSRLGQKDEETQEMLKALWYTKFASAFMKNGLKPIRIADIDSILA